MKNKEINDMYRDMDNLVNENQNLNRIHNELLSQINDQKNICTKLQDETMLKDSN